MYGLQPDGTFKSILESAQADDLNQMSIQVLMDMGYEYQVVVKALRALRDSNKYNPIGEVEKAIDWINNYQERMEKDQLKILLEMNQMEEKTHAFMEGKVKELSLKEIKAKQKSIKEEKKVEAKPVYLQVDNLRLS